MKSFILENEVLCAEIIDYGARLKSLIYKPEGIDVCVGCDTPEDYLLDEGANFGATIGRYCNRIAGASFTLDGEKYTLPANDGTNCLHGGKGFAFRTFDCKKISDTHLECRYTAQDGEQGFPGKIEVCAEYILEENALRMVYHATTDKPTVCALTNHSYYNLNGGGDVLGHVLQINADEYLPVDARLIPKKEPCTVVGTPFDFTEPHEIGERINEESEQLATARGYDHTFILRGEGMRHAATLASTVSGIIMNLYTDTPGVQLYTANFMNNEKPLLRGGEKQQLRHGVCLETQFFPDSPNRPDFPSAVLRPGEKYESETKLVFNS